MPDVKVYQDEAKSYNPWTFSVDGQPSGYWCPTEHAARRVVSRLEQGRSREAFGGPTAALAGAQAAPGAGGRARVHRATGEPRRETRTTKKGEEKVRIVEPGWRVELDGEDTGLEHATEQEARVAAAFAAFMTRGKLGRLREAEQAFMAQNGQAASVAYDGKSVVATTEDGARYAVRLAAGEAPRFKALGSEEGK